MLLHQVYNSGHKAPLIVRRCRFLPSGPATDVVGLDEQAVPILLRPECQAQLPRGYGPSIANRSRSSPDPNSGRGPVVLAVRLLSAKC